MIKALFFDIDGTLVSFKTHQIPKDTVDAIRKAKQKGVSIFIATGRPISIINNLKEIEQYIDGYVTANGAYCFIGDRVIDFHHIPQESVFSMIADADKRDYAVIVVGEKDIAIHNFKPRVDEIFRVGLNVVDIDYTMDFAKLRDQKILQLTPFISVEEEKTIMPLMKGCVAQRWHPEFTDIISDQANKGKGVELMATAMGLGLDEIMAFGDGGNDIDMIRTAGIGIAMGNAFDELKAVADEVTTSVDDNGIGLALKRHGVID